MTLPYKIIVVCRGRALLCPLNPDKANVISIGRSKTPPLQDTIILLHTDKSSFIFYFNEFNNCSRLYSSWIKT